MIDLPLCRWRGREIAPNRVVCSSPKLIVDGSGVAAEACLSCYCCNHEPVAAKAPIGACHHLLKRARDHAGAVKRRGCDPCPDHLVDLFLCDHPGTNEEVTLIDCQCCSYKPGSATQFERVYLINLKTRPDRLLDFRHYQNKNGWHLPDPIVFPAIAGDVVGVPTYFRQGGGAWGCLRSHCRILEDCIMDGVGSVLVFEDDVEWMTDAWDRLSDFLRAVPADWSQLMLGGQHIQEPDSIGPGVVRVRNCQRTHAYAVRGKAIQSLLRTWYSSAVHIDWVMGNDWQRSWPVYAPSPLIFGQGGGRSDVSGRLNNGMYWNPPTNAPVVILKTTPAVARVLRSHGLHMGFKRNTEGRDLGLVAMETLHFPTEKLRDWLATLLWEVASMEGAVTTIFHDQVEKSVVAELHAGPVIEVAGETVAECLDALRGVQLRRNFSSTHVVLLRADRLTVELLPGYHRGFWIDAATGQDKGIQAAIAGDVLTGLVNWSKHTFEEAERMASVPMVWHPEVALDQVQQAFPDRICIGIDENTVELIQAAFAHKTRLQDRSGRVRRARGGPIVTEKGA